ncbi:hypothetical protein N2152v2_007788 [Parachlorella kessleri]
MESRSRERTAELTATLEESKGLEAELQAMLKGAGATAAPQVLEASAQASSKELAKLDRANAEIKRILKLVTEVEGSVVTAVKNEETLQAQLASESAEAARLRAELEASEVALEQQKQQLAAEILQVQEELEAQKQLLASAKQQAQQQAQAAAQAAGTVGLLTAWGLSAYYKAGQKKKEDGEAVKAPAIYQEDTQEMKDLKQELEQARGLVAQATQELQAAAAARKEMEAGRELKEAEVSAMQIKLRELQHQVDNANLALGEERRAGQKATARCEALSKELADLKGDLATAKNENAKLQGKIGMLEEQLTAGSSAKEELARVRAELAKARSDNEDLQEAVWSLEDRLKLTLHAAEQEASDLKRQLDGLLEAPGAHRGHQHRHHHQQWQVSGPASQPKVVNVHFKLQRQLQMGQGVTLVGSHPALGAWELGNGVRLSWNDGHVWQAEAPLPPGSTVEFKCVLVAEGQDGWAQWEEGHNHILHVPLSNGTSTMEVEVEWGVGEVITTRRPSLGESDMLSHEPEMANGADVAEVKVREPAMAG